MLPRRVFQFFIIYLLFLGGLMVLKYSLALSDYVIPAPSGIFHTLIAEYRQYSLATLNTMTVAVIGQILSVAMALVIGITGRQSTWLGSFIKVAAYNFQAYPIVALGADPLHPARRRFSHPLVDRGDDLLFPGAALRFRNHVQAG